MISYRPYRGAIATALALALGAAPAFAASHREAPLMTLDPGADISDVYAFVSYDAANLARPATDRKATLIMNVVPSQEPSSGPNYFAFDDNVLYQLHVDNDRDGAAEDLVYEFKFETEQRSPDQHQPIAVRQRQYGQPREREERATGQGERCRALVCIQSDDRLKYRRRDLIGQRDQADLAKAQPQPRLEARIDRRKQRLHHVIEQVAEADRHDHAEDGAVCHCAGSRRYHRHAAPFPLLRYAAAR